MHMTRFSPVEECVSCGGLLVPPYVVADSSFPPNADYVCLACGQLYQWQGNPPRLTAIAPLTTPDGDENDE
jgi:hypothetical protein